ncbi:SpoIIIAH-like family protein [Halalkalibacter hemicellulosilyticus]|uniref:Stage III sporulation protein AH n=1 Tax=Halalkalibacter hemicellulosilyticusJCM 9152 TaxID=1236971 RepID=W4QJS3_9BACI|nr:SpoIIIAH-like family protein [Halalkalibacter hemicellulosilyticus]GAE31873.1 stage III sporulation protein AH [Halalkalibacter hemicellulosilyticusJCM 9152]
MVLKKQTVWLLTMLSLIIVLSVYYVIPTDPAQNDFAYSDEDLEGDELQDGDENEIRDQEDLELESDDVNAVLGNIADELDVAIEEGEYGEISTISTNEAFTTIRMEVQANRDRLKEEYTRIRASEEATAEEKADAHQLEADLHQLQNDEVILEQLILAKGFDDALVLADQEQVRVLVQSEDLSREQANELLQLTISQLNLNLDETSIAVGHTGMNK